MFSPLIASSPQNGVPNSLYSPSTCFINDTSSDNKIASGLSRVIVVLPAPDFPGNKYPLPFLIRLDACIKNQDSSNKMIENIIRRKLLKLT